MQDSFAGVEESRKQEEIKSANMWLLAPLALTFSRVLIKSRAGESEWLHKGHYHLLLSFFFQKLKQRLDKSWNMGNNIRRWLETETGGEEEWDLLHSRRIFLFEEKSKVDKA